MGRHSQNGTKEGQGHRIPAHAPGGRHARATGRPSQPPAAPSQRPVLRTLTALVLGGAICAGIIGLDALGIVDYPQQPEEAATPAPRAQETEPAHEDGGLSDESVTPPAEDASVSDASSSQVEGTAVVSYELRDMLDAGEVSSILLIGDSITAGYLADGSDAPSDTGVTVYSGPEGSYLESATTVRSWANDFRQYAYDHGVDSFVNAGINGFKMQYLAEDPSAWLDGGADVIVVMLGTNDAARRTEDEFKADAEIGLGAAAANCRLLIVVSPPANERTDATNLYDMARVDQILTELCDMKGYVHVSLLGTLEPGGDDFNPDQVHPTTGGQDKLWESFAAQLALE